MPSGKSALKTTSIKVNLIPRHPVFEEYLHVEIFCDFSRKHEVLLLLRLSSVLLYTNLLLRFTCGLTKKSAKTVEKVVIKAWPTLCLKAGMKIIFILEASCVLTNTYEAVQENVFSY